MEKPSFEQYESLPISPELQFMTPEARENEADRLFELADAGDPRVEVYKVSDLRADLFDE